MKVPDLQQALLNSPFRDLRYRRETLLSTEVLLGYDIDDHWVSLYMPNRNSGFIRHRFNLLQDEWDGGDAPTGYARAARNLFLELFELGGSNEATMFKDEVRQMEIAAEEHPEQAPRYEHIKGVLMELISSGTEYGLLKWYEVKKNGQWEVTLALDAGSKQTEPRKKRGKNSKLANSKKIVSIDKKKSRTDVGDSVPESTLGKNPKIDESFMRNRLSELREKLLELSRRNPLISFKHTAKGASFIRVVDENPEVILQKLSSETMSFKALPALELEPPDERTNKFQTALQRRKQFDELYVTEIDTIENDQRLEDIEKEQLIAAAESTLRENIRQELGLPARQKNKI